MQELLKICDLIIVRTNAICIESTTKYAKNAQNMQIWSFLYAFIWLLLGGSGIDTVNMYLSWGMFMCDISAILLRMLTPQNVL